MSTIYSTRFYGGQIVAAGETDLYTVPAGKVAVVRDISVSNVTTTDAGQLLIYVLLDAGNADLFRVASVPSHGFVQWQGRQVLNAGETLALYETNTTIRAMVSGYLLSAP